MNNCLKDEVNLLLSNTSFTREEIYRWHDGFIVGFGYFGQNFSKTSTFRKIAQKDNWIRKNSLMPTKHFIHKVR